MFSINRLFVSFNLKNNFHPRRLQIKFVLCPLFELLDIKFRLISNYVFAYPTPTPPLFEPLIHPTRRKAITNGRTQELKEEFVIFLLFFTSVYNTWTATPYLLSIVVWRLYFCIVKLLTVWRLIIVQISLTIINWYSE